MDPDTNTIWPVPCCEAKYVNVVLGALRMNNLD